MAFSFSQTVTLNHAKVSGSDQTNFPVCITGTFSFLKTVANGGDVQNPSGYDVVFSTDSAGSSRLTWETALYNGITGEVEYWVKIPTLSHTVDTVIYICYGDASIVTDQSNKTAVWSSSFAGVWHLPDGTTLTSTDSTSNANNASVTGTVNPIAGQLDGGADFPSSAVGDLNAGDTASLTDLSLAPATYSFWVKPATIVANDVVMGKSDGDVLTGWYIQLQNTGAVHLVVVRSVVDANYSFGTLTNGQWNHVAITYTGVIGAGNAIIYLNGATGSITFNGGGSGAQASDTGSPFTIGGMPLLPASALGASLDEVRVATTIRSADWIATEYNTQVAPETFFVIGNPGLSNIYTSAGTSVDQYQRYGPFVHSGNYYAFLPVDNTFSPPNPRMGLYKWSGGPFWNLQDAANSVNTAGGSKGIYYPGTGNLLYVAFIDYATRNLNLATFNMATDTWGAVITGGPHETGDGSNSQIRVWPVVLSDLTTWVILYNVGNATFHSPTDVKLITYNGAWGSPQAFNTEGTSATYGMSLIQVILDSSDRVHGWYAHVVSTTNTDLYYNNFIASTVGTSQDIFPNWNSGLNSGISTGPGIYVSGTDELIFAAQKYNGTRYDVYAIHGTPSSAPVFTSKLISTTAAGAFQDAPAILRSDTTQGVGVQLNGTISLSPYYFDGKAFGSAGNVIRCFWIWQGVTTTDNKVLYSEYSGSTWGTELTFWDRSTESLVPDFAGWITWISPNGPLGITPSNPTIACPVAPLTATVGVLYTSNAPIVTGGTAPYTFALLSGPTWMTIDAATGVVSGTPTALGAVTYTIQVTDSLGNTATVSAPCPLTVGGPTPPPPPTFCVIPPATGQENLVLVNEPLENQGT